MSVARGTPPRPPSPSPRRDGAETVWHLSHAFRSSCLLRPGLWPAHAAWSLLALALCSWPVAPETTSGSRDISPPSAESSRRLFPASSRSSATSRGTRSHQQSPAEGHDFLLLGDLRAGGQVIGVWSHPLYKKTRSILSYPHPHPGDTLHAVFLSSSFSLSFFIFKENSCSAEGAQLRRSLAAQRAQHGTAGPRNPFPGKVWAAGRVQKLPRRQRGASSGASRCNSGHLARRLKTPALVPCSRNHVFTQTPDAMRSPPPVSLRLGRLAPAKLRLWGPCYSPGWAKDKKEVRKQIPNF